jgi:hypothetical protein
MVAEAAHLLSRANYDGSHLLGGEAGLFFVYGLE